MFGVSLFGSQRSQQPQQSNVKQSVTARVLKTALVVAPIFLALQAMSSLPVANAGVLCFVWCMSACTAGTAGAFAPACAAACVPLCATNPV